MPETHDEWFFRTYGYYVPDEAVIDRYIRNADHRPTSGFQILGSSDAHPWKQCIRITFFDEQEARQRTWEVPLDQRAETYAKGYPTAYDMIDSQGNCYWITGAYDFREELISSVDFIWRDNDA